jgi:hypothetical protein
LLRNVENQQSFTTALRTARATQMKGIGFQCCHATWKTNKVLLQLCAPRIGHANEGCWFSTLLGNVENKQSFTTALRPAQVMQVKGVRL